MGSSFSSPGLRHAVVVARLAVPGDLHGALGLGLVGGLLRPGAGDDVVGRLARVAQEVHGDHAELQQGPALQEEDAVVVGNAQQRAEIGFGLGHDLLELLRAVADFQDRDAGARQGQQVALGLFQGGQGQNGRTGREIVDALFHDQNLQQSRQYPVLSTECRSKYDLAKTISITRPGRVSRVWLIAIGPPAPNGAMMKPRTTGRPLPKRVQ